MRACVMAGLAMALLPAAGADVSQVLRGVGITRVTADPVGNVYIAGYVTTANPPVTAGAVQPAYGGGSCGTQYHSTTPIPCKDAFLVKLAPDGAVIYATYLGGSGDDLPIAIAADASGNLYVTGSTYSADFPTTAGAWQRRFMGPPQPMSSFPNDFVYGDIFVAKINPTGTALVYSTLVGGPGSDVAHAMAIDPDGIAFVAGRTFGPANTFPTTPGAYEPSPPRVGDSPGVLFKLNADGSALAYSTYFEGGINALAVDAAGNVCLTGSVLEANLPVTPGALQTTAPGGNTDAYVAKMNADGSRLVYATYLGGSGADSGNGIAMDEEGHAWVTGATDSPDFPLVNPVQRAIGGGTDAFLTKLDASGSALLFSTYLGGKGNDTAQKIATDASGGAILSGWMASPDFPTTADAMLRGPCYTQDVVSRFGPDGALLYSSYLTAAGQVGVTSGGKIAVASSSGASLIDTTAPPPMFAGCVLDAASVRVRGRIAPGELVRLYGSGMGPAGPVGAQIQDGRVSSSLGGVRVLFDGVAAPLLYVQEKRIDAIVPYELAGKTSVKVEVEFGGRRTPALSSLVDKTAPEIFTADGSGMGAAAALNEDGTLNSPANPAKRGSIVVMWATGAGLLEPLPETGSISAFTAKPRLPLSVRFTEPIDAEVLYAGAAPGMVSGVIQINVRIPPETRVRSDVPIFLRIGDAGSSGSGAATIAVE